MRHNSPAKPTPTATADVKKTIRRRVLAARDALPDDERRRKSKTIVERALLLPEIANATTLMAFASFGSEVDTGELIATAVATGKIVYLPRVLAPRLMTAVRVADPAQDLEPGTWGIPEPRDVLPQADPQALDAVVVPGVVFDVDGARYGYGGGFYDSYLPLTRSGVPRLSLAFDLQVVEELPLAPHDLTVDVIVTETRVIRCA
jgi:5-formyltetrahydrofolate cyclo-ligase